MSARGDRPGAASSAEMAGLLLIDKPGGMTSHDAVDRVRRSLGIRKVGHAGTLDPMATGLLLMGVGRATRLLRFLGDLHKVYRGTGLLGEETDTLDAEGTVVRRAPTTGVDEASLRGAIAEFVGDVEQVPPAYSAVKVGGERLYRAARKGRAVEAPTRTVRVDRFDLTAMRAPEFDFVVECSGGTYVRALVADVGGRLGCGAHLTRLRRTAIGPFDVTTARAPDAPGDPLPMEAAVGHLPAVEVIADEAEAASHGRPLGPAGLAGPYRVTAPDGSLIGIYRDDIAKAIPEVILVQA
ncbi:MAG TPA: tRNA pseudouridine(55) synthase TruB [Actinomycetota bacterium]|jgi:tRNA pseudouridine55 synthase